MRDHVRLQHPLRPITAKLLTQKEKRRQDALRGSGQAGATKPAFARASLRRSIVVIPIPFLSLVLNLRRLVASTRPSTAATAALSLKYKMIPRNQARPDARQHKTRRRQRERKLIIPHRIIPMHAM